MKKNITTITVLCLICFSAVILTVLNINEAKPAMLNNSLQPKIIIDAGHGGMDGGASGYSNIVEKDINLNISLKLRDMLTLSGFDVVMIRETDEAIYDEGTTGIKNQKTSDMYNRLKFIKDNPDAIFLSIHQNHFPQAQYSGAQMFYSTNSPYSETLAKILQNRFKSILQPENKREIKKATNDLFLLYNSQIPAVLIECGFISNKDEALKLIDDDYQSKIAYTVFTSMLEFIETIN